ncbi:hypothetical protein BFJ69_g12287 [Fusarium oxysporum]|uniref:Uncharacterized protein n=1 Tax=Fusarium oxysporum TaxID=5507 RepID=A0A420MPH2_FUSOX|nr:hypothetical protein BFJ69_g12287 [Fusarium oxysporum]
MSPSPLKTPGSGSGADAGSEQASCVGSDRHQSSTTAAPAESSNVDIGSVPWLFNSLFPALHASP